MIMNMMSTIKIIIATLLIIVQNISTNLEFIILTEIIMLINDINEFTHQKAKRQSK